MKVPETTNKKQRYRRRYDKNHQIYRATDFVGDTPEVYVILYLLLEKLEKWLPGTSFVINSIDIF